MFTWVGNQFDFILNNYVLQVVSRLTVALTPVALTVTTLWILLYGWAVLRNDVAETVPTFLWKLAKISFVLALCLQSGAYISNIADNAVALVTETAGAFLPPATDPMAISSPYKLLDTFNDRASQLTLDLLMEVSITRLDLLFAAVVCSFGTVLFICIALFVISLSKVFLTFVIAVGPIFVFCMAWKPTQRFFDSWLSMLLNSVVLSWIAFFFLGLSVYMGQAMVDAVLNNGGILGPNFNPIAESLKYCIAMILMAIICFQSPSLAAGLTGGAVVQQGIQMIQNAMMVAGLRSAAKDRRLDGGGTVRPGTGMPYQAGHAAGATVAAGTRAATAAASATRRVIGLHPGARDLWKRK